MTSTLSLRRVLGVAGAMFLSLASAATADDFYKGKTLRLVVGFGAGGGYDLYSRLVAQYMRPHIPGEPTIVVENMTGAGSMNAANYVFAVAPKDGTADRNGRSGRRRRINSWKGNIAQFKAGDLQWIGSATHSNGIISTWHTSGVATLEDALQKEINMGGVATTADSYIFPVIVNGLLGTKFKMILGYPDGNRTDLAVERGEVAGNGAASWAGILARKKALVDEKKLNLIIQIGFEKEPALPDVPLLRDRVKDQESLQISDLVSASTGIGFAYWVAPGVAADRVAILRAAFDDTMKDPAMIADATKRGFDIRPQGGAALTERVQRISATPEAILDKTARMLKWR